jgi:eukaryotic-like serine/threonine-protein kinase
LWLANIGISVDENIRKCREYARKAVAVDPSSTKAHAIYWFAGIDYQNNLQLGETQLQLKTILKQDPNESMALLGLLFIYVWAGKISGAELMYRRYAEREPFSFWTFVMPFFVSIADGKYERALVELKKGYEALSNTPSLLNIYSWALAWAGQIEEAIIVADQSAKEAPNIVQKKLGLILKHSLLGDASSVRAEITPQFYEWSHRECTWSYFVATSFALADAKDEAIDWLEHAVDLGWINYPGIAEKDPFLNNIRGEERFKKLLERVKYEWENFEV